MDGNNNVQAKTADTNPEDHDKAKKRLFVCCDGTWENAASSTPRYSTNVARFARCVSRLEIEGFEPKPEVKDHVVQVVWYSGGIGTNASLPIEKNWSGFTGAGMSNFGSAVRRGIFDDCGLSSEAGVTSSLLNAYYFLSSNYNFGWHQDEIILVGYSRGAFTVRCLAEFISEVGLLRRVALPFLGSLFRLWVNGQVGELNELKRKLDTDNLPLLIEVKIKALAEFDPVSAIVDPLNRRVGITSVQDQVPSKVDNAFLAMALNEKRSDFQPMLWKTKTTAEQIVRQCAFLGCHGDIGGGNADSGLSTLTLLWMIARVQEVTSDKENGIDGAQFDTNQLLQFATPAAVVYEDKIKSFPTTKGEITESLTLLWKIGDFLKRPFTFLFGQGTDDRVLPIKCGRDTDCPLRIHFSVDMLDKERRKVQPEVNTTIRLERAVTIWKSTSIPTGSTGHPFLEQEVPTKFEIDLLLDWVEKAEQWWKRSKLKAENAEMDAKTRVENEDEKEIDRWLLFIQGLGLSIDFHSNKEQTLVHFFERCFNDENGILKKAKSEPEDRENRKGKTPKASNRR